MRLKTIYGKERNKNYQKYRIDWAKQERSKFQTNVKLWLKPYLEAHIVYSEFPCIGTLLKIDIFDATTNIAYEISGVQHQKFNEFFQGNRLGYLNQIKRDFNKQKFCDVNNIKLIEIFPEDLPLNKEWFFEKWGVSL